MPQDRFKNAHLVGAQCSWSQLSDPIYDLIIVEPDTVGAGLRIDGAGAEMNKGRQLQVQRDVETRTVEEGRENVDRAGLRCEAQGAGSDNSAEVWSAEIIKNQVSLGIVR